jgi:hypothetical protein
MQNRSEEETVNPNDATWSGPNRLRTSDKEREQVAEILRAAMTEGRLTLEEGEERLAAVYAAKFRDELGPLTADLPDGGRQALVPNTAGACRRAAGGAPARGLRGRDRRRADAALGAVRRAFLLADHSARVPLHGALPARAVSPIPPRVPLRAPGRAWNAPDYR